jgi:hypothetical protein
MTELGSGRERGQFAGEAIGMVDSSKYVDCDENLENMIADPKKYFQEAARRAVDREPEARRLPLTGLATALTGAAFIPIVAPQVLPLGYIFLVTAAALALYAGRLR